MKTLKAVSSDPATSDVTVNVVPTNPKIGIVLGGFVASTFAAILSGKPLVSVRNVESRGNTTTAVYGADEAGGGALGDARRARGVRLARNVTIPIKPGLTAIVRYDCGALGAERHLHVHVVRNG